jgi:acetylglutamate kinase
MPKHSKKNSSPEYIAVRYASGREKEVTEKLKDLGELNSSPSQRLVIVELSKANKAKTALADLQPLLEDGTIDFVAPVLVDKESNLKQIPTDEITVRFKDEPSAKHLRDFTDEYGVKITKQNEFVPRQYIVKLETSQGKQVLEAAKTIEQAEDVEFATPNYLSEIKH